MINTLFAAVLSMSPPAGTCALPPVDDVDRLDDQARAAFEKIAAISPDSHTEAAELWRQAAHLYPTCFGAYHERTNLVIQALNAFAKAQADPARLCAHPELQAARLTRQTHAELMALSEKTSKLEKARKTLARRLKNQTQAARDAADFLDAVEPSPSVTSIIQRHDAAVTAFGACPEFRVALAQRTLASLPEEPTPPPTCAPANEDARKALQQAMAAMKRAEPGPTTTSSSEYIQLSQRLAELDGEGPVLSATRAQASSETEPDRAADAWATLARELPTCPPHLTRKHDAAVAAVTAWLAPGPHSAPADKRHALAKQILDVVIVQIESDHEAHAEALREYTSLTQLRAELRPPPVQPSKPRPTEPTPPTKPATPARPEKWIHRHRPERNMVELGAFGGAMAPASGLFEGDGVLGDYDNPRGNHQLFDAGKQRESLEAIENKTGVNEWYRPYRKVAPEIGLRVAYLPVSYFGAELEGGVLPTRVIDYDGSVGARATLFVFRGHLIAQLPFWRITPFFLIGGGLLGTTGALGKDIDPSLNLGVGLKLHVSHRLMLRLDVRETRAARLRIDAGGTNYPEVLLGLSVTLNRPRAGEKKAHKSIASTKQRASHED